MPGIATSRTRQRVSPRASDARNASADENAWAAKPNCRSRSGSDSRTDSSSSTTATSERSVIPSFIVPAVEDAPLRANRLLDLGIGQFANAGARVDHAI
jgi:hypothetical protein